MRANIAIYSNSKLRYTRTKFIKQCLRKTSTSFSLSLHLTFIFPRGPGLVGTRNVSILDFIGAKDDGGGGDNWS